MSLGLSFLKSSLLFLIELDATILMGEVKLLAWSLPAFALLLATVPRARPLAYPAIEWFLRSRIPFAAAAFICCFVNYELFVKPYLW